MIRTLKSYLAKDLAKAALQATVAFTLVMTVFAVIEPLRKQGLSGSQALRFLGYILPLMFSLTLPFAAVFAATMVYGRFSQDNELMACRASGICTLAVLGPAFWLATIVAALALGLGLYVAPQLLILSERTAKNDLQQIAYHRLKKHRYITYANWLFHADEVSPESGWVIGVVALDTADALDARCLTAASAKLAFAELEGRTVAIFHPTNAAVFSQSGRTVGMEDEQRLKLGELPSIKDRPKMYDWSRLWRTWAHPEESPLVARGLERIRRKICIQNFYQDVVGAIRSEGKYGRLREFAPAEAGEPLRRVEIEARSASIPDGKEVRLGPDGPAAADEASAPRTVTVREYSGQRLKREFFARGVIVRAFWDRLRSSPMLALIMTGVRVRFPGDAAEGPLTKAKAEIGPFAVPDEVVAEARAIRLEDLLAETEQYRQWPSIVSEIKYLRTSTVEKLLAKVEAELHQRLAYGFSCFFTVMLGAALGLLFRGGQALAAFAISAVPAAGVMILLLMGRQMIANPGVPAVYGIGAVWGGVGLLALGTVYVYASHMRR